MATNQEKKITKNIKKKIGLNVFLIFLILPLFLEVFSFGGFSDITHGFGFIDQFFKNAHSEQDYVEFFNIGQGDCTLIKSGDSAVLIDFGIQSDNNIIYKNLLKRGIKKLELAVITHHHSDHMGDFLNVAENMKINRLIINNSAAEDGEEELYKKIIEAANKNGTEIILPKVGSTFKFGNASLEILSVNTSATEENNRSIITMVNICGKNILFTGDSDYKTEQALTENADVNCDILKLGHHGSADSSYTDFLKATSPELAVASCGYDNLYNHPATKTVQRVSEQGIAFLRTDLDRSIKIVFNNTDNNYRITTERGIMYVDSR